MEPILPTGPLLLYSTSPNPSPAAAIELAKSRHPDGCTPLRMVVLQTPLDHPSAEQVEILHRQFSGHGVTIKTQDAGLHDRDDAFRDDVAATIREADIILVTGGHPGRLVQVIEGTPSFEALREASVRGAVIGGGSAGAMCFGAGMLEGPRDASIPLPLFGWLPDIVVAPHFGNYSITPWREAFPDCAILGLPDRSVVLVTENGEVYTSVGEIPFKVIGLGKESGIEIAPGNVWRLNSRT